MQWVIETFLKDLHGRVLDVGSRQVENQIDTYKPLFANTNLSYLGCDIVNGDNVDILMPGLYDIPSFCGQFEAVITGQTIEHIEDTLRWLKALFLAVQRQGYLVIIGPWLFQIHRHPIDCWRILPDGYRWLFSQIPGATIRSINVRACDVAVVVQKK